MDLKNQCLFCLKPTVPYSVSSTSTSINGEDLGVGIIRDVREEVAVDFQTLCTYLGVSFPKKEKGYEGAVLSSSCDKFLCISCFKMVDQLSKLRKELRVIQRNIREVIMAHDISAKLPSGNKDVRRRKVLEKKVGASTRGKRRSQENDCWAFVKMFQTVVKGAADANDIDYIEMESATTTTDISPSQENPGKDVMNDKRDTEVSNQQINPVNVKIEGGEEEMNYGVEGATDSFADFPNESLDSFGGNEMDGQEDECKTSRGIEARAESEDEDDAEWKPEVKKKRPTSKRKSKLRQVTIQSKPRKKRRTSPEASIKVEDLKFKCADCDLGFTTWKKRTEHRQKFHPRKTSTLQRLVASIPTASFSTRTTSTLKRSVASIPTASSSTRKIRYISVHICTICGKHVKERGTSKLLNYMEHMLSHDEQSSPEESGPHSCTQCDKQFNLKINLDLHEACVHDTRQQVINCIICAENINYRTREALIEHLKSSHGDIGDTVHSCKHCPMSFISFEKLLTHMMKHRGCKRLLCPECIEVCSTTKELHEHCYKVHPQLKEKFNCELCDKFYLDRSSFRAHMERDHGFERRSNTFKEDLANANLTCPRCPPKDTARIYKTAAALRSHTRNCHEEQRGKFKCDLCDNKYFPSRKRLQSHIETSHEKIRHPCPHCPKSYSDTYSLNYHMKTHTGEGLLTCDVCSKQFPRMLQLRSHMRVHMTKPDPEEKRVCEDCGKEFPDQHRLMKHKQNVHPKGTKECTVCGLVLKRRDHLRSHMRIHSGERPYQCPACKKCFNRRDILRVHVKGVHGMELAEAEEKYKDT